MIVQQIQLVLLYNQKGKKELPSNLQTSWEGPYKIKRLNDVVYRKQKANSPRVKIKVVHIERVAKYGRIDNEPIRVERQCY